MLCESIPGICFPYKIKLLPNSVCKVRLIKGDRLLFGLVLLYAKLVVVSCAKIFDEINITAAAIKNIFSFCFIDLVKEK
jgi:hypothetical protein